MLHSPYTDANHFVESASTWSSYSATKKPRRIHADSVHPTGLCGRVLAVRQRELRTAHDGPRGRRVERDLAEVCQPAELDPDRLAGRKHALVVRRPVAVADGLATLGEA